jgi:hypothetical protein
MAQVQSRAQVTGLRSGWTPVWSVSGRSEVRGKCSVRGVPFSGEPTIRWVAPSGGAHPHAEVYLTAGHVAVVAKVVWERDVLGGIGRHLEAPGGTDDASGGARGRASGGAFPAEYDAWVNRGWARSLAVAAGSHGAARRLSQTAGCG